MRIYSRHFPHPVLAYFLHDFPNSNFEWKPEVKVEGGRYEIKATFNLQSPTLTQLIKDGKACFAAHVECPASFYRCMRRTTNTEIVFEIEAELLEGTVDLCGFVIAKERIRDYQSSEFAREIHGASFNIRRGDILAVAEPYKFIAEKYTNPFANLSSIFGIQPSPDSEAPALTYDLSTDQIVVFLRPETFERFKRVEQSQVLQEALSSMAIIPVLVSVLEKLLGTESDLDGFEHYRELGWFQVLTDRMKRIGVELGSDSENAAEVAHRLIGEPIDEAVKKLEEILAEDD